MKPEKKDIKKWVKALRSGKYKQTTGTLEDKNGHCCLGVACDIFIPKNLQARSKEGFLRGGMPSVGNNAPEWLDRIDAIFNKLTDTYLVSLNDGEKLTFDEIADVLELVYIHEILKEETN